MGMEIGLLRAGLGDCILVRCGKDEKKVNLLIDSGLTEEYFSEALDRIKMRNEKIDLLIFTHDDSDHIKGAAGLIKQMRQKETGRELDGLYGRLWKGLTEERVLFNFGGNGTEALLGVKEAKELYEGFKEMDIPKLGFVLADAAQTPDVPYPNLIQLRWKNTGDGLVSKVVRQPAHKDLQTEEEHLEVVILGPGKQALAGYIRSAWEKTQEKEVLLKAGKKETDTGEWEKTVQYWMEHPTEKKDTVRKANQASIAFLLFYEGKCGLFAGDAYPADLVRTGKEYLARKQADQEFMEVDFIKLPHHGSSHNISKEFLEFFRTKTYFITTCGNVRYRHPGKVTLALIASVLKKGETAHIYSSYAWWKEVVPFLRSEKYSGDWREEGNLCVLKDADGDERYLRFHKTERNPEQIGDGIAVSR